MSEIIKTGLVERIEQLIAEAKKRTISAVNTAMIGQKKVGIFSSKIP